MKRDGFSARAAYSFGDIYGGGAFLITGVLFLAYLTNVEGISGVMAGVIILVGKLWDAVTDPFMGMISDMTRSKFGRRRIFFLVGSIPVLLSWIMLWHSFGIPEGTARVIYYIVAYIFFSTAFTIVMVPYNSILPEMTDDYEKRSAFTGMRLSFSAGTALICAIIPAMITGSFESQKAGYLVMGVIFGVIFALSWLIVFWGTWENQRPAVSTKINLKEWVSVFKNRSFRFYVLIFIASQMAIDITMALAVYYLNVSVCKPGLFVPAMAAILVVQLVFIILFSAVLPKKDKKTPALISALVWTIANIMIFSFTSSTPEWLIIAVCALIGVGAAGCNMVSWSVLPDISDVDELITGKRREGLYAGVSTFLRKLSGGIIVGVTGILLDVFRYSSTAVDLGQIEPVTDYGIRIMFCIIPVIFLAVMFVTLRKYPLGQKEFKTLHEVLEQMRLEGKNVKVDRELETVCEELTGITFENLYYAED